MRLFVTGGCGYIGSHFVSIAKRSGYEVIVFDNLSTGHAGSVADADLKVGDLLDLECVVSSMKNCDAVVHFAAKSIVQESSLLELDYWRTNVVGTYNLLQAMEENGIKKFILSSTAAVYGDNHADLPLSEAGQCRPVNCYGMTKLVAENLVAAWATRTDSRAIAFRYFNAAGALPGEKLGEQHTPETHLIPSVIAATSADKSLIIYGSNYPTPDGTCVRDYIHVADIAESHLAGLQYMESSADVFEVFNVGSGIGYSILEIIDACERIANTKVHYRMGSSRRGDPAILIAGIGRAQQLLGWKPRYSTLSQIVGSAFEWHNLNYTLS